MVQFKCSGRWVVSLLVASASMSCGEASSPTGEQASPEAYDVSYEALSVAGLPKCSSAIAGTVGYVTQDATLWRCTGPKFKWVEIECDNSNAGAVAYASGSQTLLACAARRWTVVPLPQGGPGPQGEPGEAGPAGPAGMNGASGADGETPLVVVVEEPEGAHCPSGGSRVDVGVDHNGNGTLEASERTSSTYVCDGFDGSDAPVDDTLQDLILSLTQTQGDALLVSEDAPVPNTAQVSVALRARPHGAKGVRVQSSGPSALVNGAPHFDLVFTADTYATPQTVTITTPTDQNLDEPADAVLTVGLCEVECDLATFTGTRTVAVDAREDDVQSIILSRSTVTVTEGLTAAFDVSLAFEPIAGATELVSLASSDVGAATGQPTSLAFTAADYATPRSITVSGVADADVLGETVTLTLASNIASTPIASVLVHASDDDVQAILLSRGSTTLHEAPQGDSFNVTLQQDPSGTLVVNLASGDASKVTLQATTLTFNSSNYMVPQPAQVTTVSDDDVRNESIDITLSATGVQTDAVFNVVVLDDDDQGLVVSPFVTVVQGGVGYGSVRLAFAPTAPLVIAASVGDSPFVTLDGTTLTFDASNYATDQFFEVTATPAASPLSPLGSITYSVVSGQGNSPPEGTATISVPLSLQVSPP